MSTATIIPGQLSLGAYALTRRQISTLPTITSVAHLKRLLQVGVTYRCIDHVRPALIGSLRTVTHAGSSVYRTHVVELGGAEHEFYCDFPKAAGVSFPEPGTWVDAQGWTMRLVSEMESVEEAGAIAAELGVVREEALRVAAERAAEAQEAAEIANRLRTVAREEERAAAQRVWDGEDHPCEAREISPTCTGQAALRTTRCGECREYSLHLAAQESTARAAHQESLEGTLREMLALPYRERPLLVVSYLTRERRGRVQKGADGQCVLTTRSNARSGFSLPAARISEIRTSAGARVWAREEA